MINIYVEGKPDERLIEGIIKNKFPTTTAAYKIVTTGGYTNIKKHTILSEENRDNEGINLVVFDADSSTQPDGGVLKRKEYITAQNIFVDDVFLFPNNTDDGDIEILLEQIVNPNHQQIINSFNRFQEDIGSKDFTTTPDVCKYIVPAQKSKIFAYADILKNSYAEHKNSAKNISLLDTRVYCLPDTDFWDLESEALLPLIQFLQKYFKL